MDILVTKPPAIEAEDILLRILPHEFLQVIHVRLLEPRSYYHRWGCLIRKTMMISKNLYHTINMLLYIYIMLMLLLHIMSCDHGLRAAQHLFIQNVRSIYIRH